jgi:hypothetical protein
MKNYIALSYNPELKEAQEVYVMAKNLKEAKSKIHTHLSTTFVIVGIVSFTLGAIVNFYTIKRLNGIK